jgi:salicylate hydroxylase
MKRELKAPGGLSRRFPFGNGLMTSSSMKGANVLVIGAGVAGLTLATALAQRGAVVRVLEQAASLDDVGAGLQISANGAVVLQALGMGQALLDHSLQGQAVDLFDGLSGRRVLRMDLAKVRPDHRPYYLHRADLITLLAAAARQAGVALHLGAEAVGVDLSGQSPVLLHADGSREACDLILGADGLKSQMRQALNGVTAPFFTRQAAWRAVIPEQPGAEIAAQVHMGPGRHLVTYPLRGGLWRNIVAVEERGSWLAEGWAHKDDPANLQKAFSAFSPKVRGWLGQIESVGVWGLFRHPVARVWQRVLPRGAVAILGDAAHPTLPFLAQGANMAMEDASVLSDVLAKRGVSAESMNQYQSLREARCRRIVDAATTNASLYHLRSPLRGPAYMALGLAGRIAPDRMIGRYDWLWGHDVTRETPE